MTDKKTVDQMTLEEYLAFEDSLRKYDGQDKVVSSLDVAADLAKRTIPPLKISTYIESVDRMLDGVEESELVVVTGPTGQGKSLTKGTLVLMYDGTYRKVEDIRIGDKVMGKDSTPRNVLSLGHGKEEMFKVTPKRGQAFVCNKSHILSVVRTTQRKTNKKKWLTYRYETLHLEEYMKLSKTQKHLTYLYRVAVEFPNRNTTFDPYFLGLWLGDGTTGKMELTHSVDDIEILDYHARYAHELGGRLSLYRDKRSKGVCARYCGVSMKDYLPVKKHIPYYYKVNSRENRLKLLAGILDSDGYTNLNGYVFVNKNKILADDVLFVARSLGFFAESKRFTAHSQNGTVGTYYKVNISGDCSVIPVLTKRKKVNVRRMNKDILRTGIKSVKSVGLGEYFGITLDGDHEYLLEDFTVTHNTSTLLHITRKLSEHNIKTLWFSYEMSYSQLINKMQEQKNVYEFFVPKEITNNQIDFIERKIMEARAKFDIRTIFIDHLSMLYSLDKYSRGNASLELGDIVAKIKAICLRHGVIIFLVAHSKKVEAGAEIFLEDIRDSGHIANLADSVLTVQRVPNDYKEGDRRIGQLQEGDNRIRIKVEKNRRRGTRGSLLAEYHNGLIQEIPKATLEQERLIEKSYKDF